jgi:pyruvate,water dikinase
VIELWKLSRLVHSDPALGELLAGCEESELWERLREDERFAVFRKEFETFLEDWGFRCSGELMMTVKSFQEDPSGVFSLLKSYVALDGESPVEMLQRQAEERRSETKRVFRALRRRKVFRWLPWPNMKFVAKIVLRWTQRAIGLRERARLKQSLLYSRCRRVVVRIGEKLVERGFLKRSEDVFFLTHQELDALVSGGAMFPRTVSSLVELRRTEHSRLGEMTLPDTMTLPEGAYSDPDKEAGRQEPFAAEDNSDVMSGIGVCGGRVTARATVLRDVSESGRLTAGDILVTRQTDPGWAPVFFVVSGLVMERGGMLSHGAIVAREYGIPTVVGVDGATRRIGSGQTVSVDGDAGRVEIIG